MKHFIAQWWPKKMYVLPNGKSVAKPYSLAIPMTLVVMVLMYYAAQITGFKVETLIRRGNQFFVILGKMFPPDIDYVSAVSGPLIDTIKMSALGSIVGALLAIPAAVLSSQNIVKNSAVTGGMKFLLSLVRTIPTLIYASILTLVFGIGTFAGTVAIALFTFSFLAKQLYEMIENVDMRPYEAMEALGANRLDSFVGAVLPQVAASYIAGALYTFEGNVRHAAILGYVGAGGIGIIMNETISWREYPKLGMILIALFVAVMVIESLSRYLRSKLT